MLGSQGAPLSSLGKVRNLGNPSAASSCPFAPFSFLPLLSLLGSFFSTPLCRFLFLPVFQFLCLPALKAFSPAPPPIFFFFFLLSTPPCFSLFPSPVSFFSFFILPLCHSFPLSPLPFYPLLQFHLFITFVALGLNSMPGRGARCKDKNPLSFHKLNPYSTPPCISTLFSLLGVWVCPRGSSGVLAPPPISSGLLEKSC